jgi:hypothetical protein
MRTLPLRLPEHLIQKLDARMAELTPRRPSISRADVAREIIAEFFLDEEERRRACTPPPDTPK